MCFRAEALYSYIHVPEACNRPIRASQIEEHPVQWRHPLCPRDNNRQCKKKGVRIHII